MLSRRRIRIALLALIVLAIVGWFAQRAMGVGNPGPPSGSLPSAELGHGVALASAPLSEAGTVWGRVGCDTPTPVPDPDA